MKIIEQTGEEPEERLRLERGAERFVGMCEDHDDDGQNLGAVHRFRLVRRLAVVLDDERYESCKSVDGLEDVRRVTGEELLSVALDADFCADAEKGLLLIAV